MSIGHKCHCRARANANECAQHTGNPPVCSDPEHREDAFACGAMPRVALPWLSSPLSGTHSIRFGNVRMPGTVAPQALNFEEDNVQCNAFSDTQTFADVTTVQGNSNTRTQMRNMHVYHKSYTGW